MFLSSLLHPSLLSWGQDSQGEMLRPPPPSGTFHVSLELQPSPEASPSAWPLLQRTVLTHSRCSQPPTGKPTGKADGDTGLSQEEASHCPLRASSVKAPGSYSIGLLGTQREAGHRGGCRSCQDSWSPTNELMGPAQLLTFIY